MLSYILLQSLVSAALIAILLWFVSFGRKWHKHRLSYRSLPGPPHSYWLGHLKVLGEVMKELPPNIHMQVAVTYIAQKYDLKGVFYLDMWPASRPFMIILDPDVATQLTVTHNTPKHPAMKEFLGDLTGSKSVITMEGQPWKQVRSLLMPTYAPSYLLSLVPIMSKHVAILCEKLVHVTEEEKVTMISEYTTDLTIDIIGEVIIDTNLNAQKNPHPIAQYFKKATRITSDTMANPLAGYTNAIQMWWYTRNITKELEKIVHKRYSEDAMVRNDSKLTIDLIVAAAKADHQQRNDVKGSDRISKEWMQIAVDNIKTLLLGGHDTTSATIAYMLCLLSNHPKILSKVHAEHDKVVDPSLNREEAIALLSKNPKLLNELPYTLAVIKETLRLYPTSSTSRTTSPTHQLQFVTSSALPDVKLPLALSDQIVWVLHFPMHHDPSIFPDPYKFIPERFISDLDYAKVRQPIPKEGWRPFERGPRACVGMELTMVEMKLTLLLLLREFDFEPSYSKDAPRAPDCVGGEQWYQVMEFAAKPVGGMPMKVRRRTR